jgi:uncharacterized membrane protein
MKKKVRKKVNHAPKPGFLQIIHPITSLPRTFGQKAADWITKWAGSWVFIILFLLLLAAWMALNVQYMVQYNLGQPWDPYPFILLNLVLSCIAALQAPIILMSQNRGAQKDRLRSQYDYAINRKSEREIQEIKKQLNRIEKVMMKRRK